MKKDNTWKIKMERIRRSKLWAGDMALVAVRILEFLEENDKSQRWLAAQLGVSPQQITKIVKGRQNLSWGKIKEIEKVLGIKLARIEKPSCYIIQAESSLPPTKLDWDKRTKWVASKAFSSFGKVLIQDSDGNCDHVTEDEPVGATIHIGQYVKDKSKSFAYNS